MTTDTNKVEISKKITSKTTVAAGREWVVGGPGGNRETSSVSKGWAGEVVRTKVK